VDDVDELDAVRDADGVVETHPLRCKYVYTAIDN